MARMSSSGIADSLSAALALIANGDAALWAIIGRSLAVSGTATLIGFSLGAALGAWLAVSRFRGRGLVLVGMNALLALPSVVVGLVVYLLLSRSGPLGSLGWLFSFNAMVLAQTVLVMPIVAALVCQQIEDAHDAHGEQLQAIGANRMGQALLLAWDERFALLTVGIAAFGRAISEVGFTRVMTTAIALETSKGDLPLALGLGIVLLLLVLSVNAMIGLLKSWRIRLEVMAA
jgi:tungstate transport system permease protein